MLNLREQLKKEQQFGFDFMENREAGKIKEYRDSEVTINNVDILEGITDKMTGEIKDLAVITIKEDNNHFFFGGSAITNIFKDFFEKFGKETIQELATTEGLPVKVEVKKSKKFNSEYVSLKVI